MMLKNGISRLSCSAVSPTSEPIVASGSSASSILPGTAGGMHSFSIHAFIRIFGGRASERALSAKRYGARANAAPTGYTSILNRILKGFTPAAASWRRRPGSSGWAEVRRRQREKEALMRGLNSPLGARPSGLLLTLAGPAFISTVVSTLDR